ncbi:MAG: phosphatidylglycerol lysyltransferase domain-containing protein, partial [Sarcina sp.]
LKIYLINFIVSLIFFVVLGIILKININFLVLALLYVISMIFGLLSFVPASLIIFDIIMLLLLHVAGVTPNNAFTLVLIFRITYYVIPLILCGLILLIGQWKKLNHKYNSLPNVVSEKIAFFCLRFFVFISGVALLLSTAFPSLIFKIKEIYFLSTATELHYSKTLVVVVGFLLIVMARLLKYKTKAIYILTVVFLVVGSLLTLIKSFNYIATGYFIIIALFVLISKNEFVKKSFIIGVEDLIVTTVTLVVFWLLYIISAVLSIPIKHMAMHHKLEIALHSYKYLISIGTLSLVISLIFLYSMYLIGKHFNKLPVTYVDDCIDDIDEFLKEHEGTSLTHLIYLKDKYVFFSSDKKGMIQYSILSNKLIVLGNPLGHREDLNLLISEFYDFADLYGYIPIFFEVNHSMMDILHDYGYEFMKLGEAAIVHLQEFTIQGQKMQKVRTCYNKITKAGYSFEVIDDITDELIAELKVISDVWLDGKKEMGFSMGFFDEHYIKKSPVGIVRDENNIVKAFVTIMPTYGDNKMFCSDLMRYSRETPRGLMDYMFVCLLLWGKETNYEYFNFGVSPLANVGPSKYSFFSERLASQIYYHGSMFYSFQGLRNFKAKYANTWEPKLLAYKNKLTLPVTALQTNINVSNSKQKIRKS